MTRHPARPPVQLPFLELDRLAGALAGLPPASPRAEFRGALHALLLRSAREPGAAPLPAPPPRSLATVP